MVNRISHFVSSALALLVVGEGLVKAEVYVCGIDYDDAATNCVINTACPNGECSEQTCFAIPYDQCVGWTSVPPTAAPDLYICGVTYEDALSKCHSGDDACVGVTNTTAYCAATDADVARSCYIVPSEACPTYAPSSAPISGSLVATTIMSTGPTASLAPTVSLPTVSLGSDNPAANDASTPDTLFVCGVDYFDASENFCTLTSCPTGDGCDDGVTCFAIPYASCEPVLGSMISVCGVDYPDAAMNYCANPSCPLGNECEMGQACFSIPYAGCGEESAPSSASPVPVTPMTSNSTSPTISPLPTMASSSSSTSSAPTLEVVNTLFCGVDYDDAMSSCSVATSCRTGDGCPTGMNCFTGISCAALLPPPTPVPSIDWDSIVGNGTTTPPPVPLTEKYCGVDLEDATNLCAMKTPCHDGNTLVCPSGEACFEVAGQCGNVGDMGGSRQPSTLNPSASAPSLSPISSDRCGDTYEDAVMNCRDRLACTLGATGECPTGQTCYPVAICETPTPSPADSSSPSAVEATTEKPVWELTPSNSNGSYTMTVFLAKSLVVCGATLLIILV